MFDMTMAEIIRKAAAPDHPVNIRPLGMYGEVNYAVFCDGEVLCTFLTYSAARSWAKKEGFRVDCDPFPNDPATP